MNGCRDINKLHPKVKELAEQLIAECKKQGLKLGISETLRTVERQDYLYAQGRTRPGRIVTYAKGSDMKSYHQWGLAFDVFQNIKGKEYDYAFLQKVGKIGESLGLEWGGSWKRFKDTPHFQYTFGLSIQDLKNGKKPQATPYEDAVDKLAELGIISSPNAWKPIPATKYTEYLIEHTGAKFMTYEDAVEILAKHGIIDTPSVWLQKDFKEEYVKALIQKIANK